MRQVFVVILSVFFACNAFGHTGNGWWNNENERSDSIDVTHYDVIVDWTSGKLYGECTIWFKARLDNRDTINLDLLKLNVDSVHDPNGNPLLFSYNDTILSVPISTLNEGDSTSITVFYNGTPWNEDWGGWHQGGGYSFNLGVGFESIPHNLGKVWHPCFDNFFERASYRVTIISDNNTIGIGSGVLESTQINGDTTTNTWFLRQEIPTYLYGIAIADYVAIKDTIVGIYGNKPVEIYSKPANVNAVNAAFRNLDSMYVMYERNFGPYRWDRVGYSMTSIGAMEHATNISYPIHSISSEGTIAHELSHHWWGDLVTCETDRDMWINEGMAVFSEYVFQEGMYGLDAMNRNKESNLYQVVRNAHLEEGGYQPLSGIPRVHTYGIHTYRKGSLVGHNLRRVMGDSLFFSMMTSFLDSNKFTPVNSYDFRDHIMFYSSLDLVQFFEQWVFNPGMPDFQLWDWKSDNTPGLHNVEISIRQNLAGAPFYFNRLPMTVRFWSDANTYWDEVVEVGKSFETFNFQFPTEPVRIELNPNYELSYAMTSIRDTLISPGQANGTFCDISTSFTSVPNSINIRTEAHWAGPYISVENMVKVGARINPNRYFNISGFGMDSSTSVSTFTYDANSNKLDSGLIQYTEDSLILLYRPMGGEWVEHEDYTIIIASPNDKKGVVQFNDVRPGEYALAEKDSTINEDLLGVPVQVPTPDILLYPNPADDYIKLSTKKQLHEVNLYVLDIKGREKEHIEMEDFSSDYRLDLSSYNDGVYFYIIESREGSFSGRFIKGKYSK